MPFFKKDLGLVAEELLLRNEHVAGADRDAAETLHLVLDLSGERRQSVSVEVRVAELHEGVGRNDERGVRAAGALGGDAGEEDGFAQDASSASSSSEAVA